LRQKRALTQQLNAKRLAKDQEEEEIRKLMREEKIEQLSEEDKEKLKNMSAKGLGVNLSALTAAPKPEDILVQKLLAILPRLV